MKLPFRQVCAVRILEATPTYKYSSGSLCTYTWRISNILQDQNNKTKTTYARQLSSQRKPRCSEAGIIFRKVLGYWPSRNLLSRGWFPISYGTLAARQGLESSCLVRLLHHISRNTFVSILSMPRLQLPVPISTALRCASELGLYGPAIRQVSSFNVSIPCNTRVIYLWCNPQPSTATTIITEASLNIHARCHVTVNILASWNLESRLCPNYSLATSICCSDFGLWFMLFRF